ncbi:MAG: putative ABC exporter domain-containing protein [Phycisphaerales bacterium]
MTSGVAPLALLLRLRTRARWRRFFRAIRRPKGLLAFVVSIGFMAMWLLPMLVARWSGHPGAAMPGATAHGAEVASTAEATAPSVAPFVILGLLLFTILGRSTEGALAFLQAEVDMLFPAPFARRQLLVYKLVERVPPTLFSALFISIFAQAFGSRWLSTFAGLFLVLMFLGHAALCAALAGQLLGEHRFRVWRRAATAAIVVASAGGLWWMSRQDATSLPETLRRFAGTPVGWIVALPTLPFARTLKAVDPLRELAPWAGVSLAINLALVALALRLDANWLEASVESSRRVQERIDRFRATGGLTAKSPGLRFLRLPMPPRLGGAGAIAWRQLTSAMRTGMRSLWIIAIVLGVIVVMPLLGRFSAPGDGASDASGAAAKGLDLAVALRGVGWFLLAYVGLFVPQIIRADFRGDIDRMDLLKSLPMSPTAVAAGQIAAPAIIATLLQWIIGGVLLAVVGWPFGALPLWVVVLLGASVVNVAVENILFLIWPLRAQASPGMNLIGGQMLVGVGKTFAIVVALGIAAGAAAIAGYATSWDRWAIAAGAGCIVAIEAVALVAVAGRLFAKFDAALERAPDA